MTRNFRSFFWPLMSIVALGVSTVHPPWTFRLAQLIGDFLSHTLYQWFIGLTAVLLLWRGAHGEKWLLWWPLLAGLLTPLVVEGLKRITRLPRPDGDPSGFPSGHTTFAFVLAWLLARVYPRGTPIWYGLAISIGWSRVEGHAHFSYQVLCGAALGTAVGWAISHRIARPPSGARLAPVIKAADGEA